LEQCDLGQPQQFDCCERLKEEFGNTCLGARCLDYLTCRANLQVERDAAIDEECKPTSQSGGCKILLACVRRQETSYRRQLKACVKSKEEGATTFTNSACGGGCEVKGKRARRDVERVCAGCTSIDVPTVTTVPAASTTTTSTTTNSPTTTKTTRPPGSGGGDDDVPQDRCYQDCLGRLGRLQACYSKCGDTCDDHKQAEKICRRGCRNASCPSLRSHCSGGPIGNSDDDPDRYRRCCSAENYADGCVARDEQPCRDIPTTTTTTRVPTTTVQTTTSTTSTTVFVP